MVNTDARKMMEFYFQCIEECDCEVHPAMVFIHFGFTNVSTRRESYFNTYTYHGINTYGYMVTSAEYESCSDGIKQTIYAEYCNMFRVVNVERTMYDR